MATTVVEKVIRIDVVASANAQKAIGAISADLKKIDDSSKKMSDSVNKGFGGLTAGFTRFATFLGAFGIANGIGLITKGVLDAASAYTVLESRFALLLGTQERGVRATQEVIAIAKLTGREIDGISKLYEKASRAAQQFGISEAVVTQITTGFSQSLKLSGASTQEAYAALVQFGQALGSGRLQGDEFRSLMENNSVFMYEFAKAAGFTVAELRKMGTEGKLSAEFLFKTMTKEGADGINMLERLDKQAKAIPLTFAQSFTAASVSVTEFIGIFGKFFSFTSQDTGGMFGGFTRAVSDLTQRIRELNIEANALGNGFFGRLLQLAKSELRGSAIGIIAEKLGLTDPTGKTLAGRIGQEYEGARKALEEGQKKLDALKAVPLIAGSNAAFNERANARRNAEIAAQIKLNTELEASMIKLSQTASNISYGDPPGDTGPKTRVPKPVVDDKAAKKLQSSRESLKDFIEGLEARAEASRRVSAGDEERLRTSKDLVDLESKLKEAVTGTNSALALRGRVAIRNEEGNQEAIKAAKDITTAEEKRVTASVTLLEQIGRSTLKDSEAIEALQNRTRATDEFTDALLRQGRAAKSNEVSDLLEIGGLGAANPRVKALLEEIAAYDLAILKKRELIDLREDIRTNEVATKAAKLEEKNLQDSADSINNMLKRSLRGGSDGKSVGQQLLENIKDTLRNQAVDVVINPITSLLSRALAEIAQSFSAVLTQKLNAALSGGGGGGGIFGFLSGLFSGGGGGGGGVGGFDLNGIFDGRASGGPVSGGRAYLVGERGPELMLSRSSGTVIPNEKLGKSVYVTYSPVIQVDSRTDQAQVAQIAMEASKEGNKQLIASLKAQGVM